MFKLVEELVLKHEFEAYMVDRTNNMLFGVTGQAFYTIIMSFDGTSWISGEPFIRPAEMYNELQSS